MLSCQPQSSKMILCCYVNHTDKVQIGRISNVADWYLERVIFPGQRLLFEAPNSAELEIYTNSFSTALLAQRIKCESLVCG
jgi:hypothetical protein